MQFKPKFEGYQEKVKQSFASQKFMGFIGANLIDIEPGFCEIHIPYSEDLTQQHGYFHAGIIGTLADNAAGYAAFSLMEEKAEILTVEFKLNLMSPGKGELLIGKSNVLKHGKTLTICRSEIYIQNSNETKLCAAAQSTLMGLV